MWESQPGAAAAYINAGEKAAVFVKVPEESYQV
jgi:hypothetical protein